MMLEKFSKSSILSISLVLLIGVAACAENTNINKAPGGETVFANVDAKSASELIENSAAVVIDIRTQKEFSSGHIENALHIDYHSEDFSQQISLLDRKAVYIVHCKSGGRSGRSLKVFRELGFSNVAHLHTGFDGWQAASMPVVRP